MMSLLKISASLLLLALSFESAFSAPSRNGEGSSNQNQGANQNPRDDSHIHRAASSSNAFAHATERALAPPGTIEPSYAYAYQQALPHIGPVAHHNLAEAVRIEEQRAKERQDRQRGSNRN